MTFRYSSGKVYPFHKILFRHSNESSPTCFYFLFARSEINGTVILKLHLLLCYNISFGVTHSQALDKLDCIMFYDFLRPVLHFANEPVNPLLRRRLCNETIRFRWGGKCPNAKRCSQRKFGRSKHLELGRSSENRSFRSLHKWRRNRKRAGKFAPLRTVFSE